MRFWSIFEKEVVFVVFIIEFIIVVVFLLDGKIVMCGLFMGLCNFYDIE